MIRRCIAGPLIAALLGSSVPVTGQVGPGHEPTDKDERGLWQAMAQEEAKLKTSDFVLRDPALNAYVRQALCRAVGEEECRDVRIYILRTAYFNASMAPNGMMQIWSGLLLRIRSEAELAAVLGHEYGHYERRHSLRLFREARSKSGAASFLSVFGIAGGLLALGMVASVYQFSRDMESEADVLSVGHLRRGGYDPRIAAGIWEHLRAEMDETARARNQKSRKDRSGGLFGTHPPSAERVAALRALAGDGEPASGGFIGREEYRAALAPFWPALIDDQIKLNDFGGTDFLLAQLADGAWTGQLLFARGELYRTRGRPEDLTAAATFYRDANGRPDAPKESWRGLGLALLRLGQAEEGKAALRHYLELKPDASDRPMIAAMAGVTS